MYKKILSIGLLTAVLLIGCSSTEEKSAIQESAVQENTAVEQSMRYYADKSNILVGAAIEPYQLEEKEFADTLKREFNYITPENRMKWSFIHPEEDRFDFSEADKIVDFALKNNMQIKGHALVWHIQNPEWLTSREWTREELSKVLENHIKTVVTHYKGKVHAWDVVNEAIDMGTYRDTIWYKTLGPKYIEMALMWAREADPDAKLYINDYMVEELNMKSDAYYKVAKGLVDKGIPLDGVGFQFHIDLDNSVSMSSVYENIKRYQELGLEVDFTEIDVRITGEITERKLKKQARVYAELMEIAKIFDNVNVYTTWGLTDKYSWIPSFFKGKDAGLMFDKEYNPKPAYQKVLEVLKQETVTSKYSAMMNNERPKITLPAFIAKKIDKAPVLDGVVGENEWNGINYSFGYNQLNSLDQRPAIDLNDISGEWQVTYKDGFLYGLVKRKDDKTVVNIADSVWENDNVEVFIRYGNLFSQVRTLIGSDFAADEKLGKKKAVWNKDGSILEFMIEMPESDLTGLTMGFNIALSDNDSAEGARKYQLYPTAGENISWQGNDLCPIKFEGDTPRAIKSEWPVKPFKATKIEDDIVIDGLNNNADFEDITKYKLSYNQFNKKDKSVEKLNKDIYVEWAIMYNKNKIFGYVVRKDDQIYLNDQLSDSVLISLEIDGKQEKLLAKAGGDFSNSSSFKNIITRWSEDKKYMEFSLELNQEISTGEIKRFNIAVSDNDGEGLESILTPINGFSKNLNDIGVGELIFE